MFEKKVKKQGLMCRRHSGHLRLPLHGKGTKEVRVKQRRTALRLLFRRQFVQCSLGNMLKITTFECFWCLTFGGVCLPEKLVGQV